MASKSFLYLSLLLFLVACKAQPPFFLEEYEEDDDEETEAVTTAAPGKATTKSSSTKTLSNSNSTVREIRIPVSALGKQNKPKQEDIEDETEAPTQRTTPRLNFGPQVASIITGALSGNLGTILSGSFNLVPNSGSRENVNKAWESIAGITTIRTSTIPTSSKATTKAAVTEAEDDEDEELDGRIVVI